MNNRRFAWPIRHATLAPLADPAIFVTAAVGDWGGSVIWNGDDRLALAADNPARWCRPVPSSPSSEPSWA